MLRSGLVHLLATGPTGLVLFKVNVDPFKISFGTEVKTTNL
jgi:hypothetical protein